MKKRRNQKSFPNLHSRPRKAQSSGISAEKAMTEFRNLPTYAIAAVMNQMIDVLRERGQEIRDWDEKEKVLQKISIIGGRTYALAPCRMSIAAHAHTESGAQTTEPAQPDAL